MGTSDVASRSLARAVRARAITDAFGIDVDAGERRDRQIAQALVVVNADDGYVIRHGGADAPAGVDDLDALLVVARHQADGLGEPANPLPHEPLLFFPGDR